MILTLQELGVDDRDIHLFDTFEGMTAPDRARHLGRGEPPALETWKEAQEGERARRGRSCSTHEIFNEEPVRETLLATGYPERAAPLRPRPGRGDAARQHARAELALLRLDTDWYESTQPRAGAPLPAPRGRRRADHRRLRPLGGRAPRGRRVLRARTAAPLLLNRIDYTGRIAVKTLTGWPDAASAGGALADEVDVRPRRSRRRWLK